MYDCTKIHIRNFMISDSGDMCFQITTHLNIYDFYHIGISCKVIWMERNGAICSRMHLKSPPHPPTTLMQRCIFNPGLYWMCLAEESAKFVCSFCNSRENVDKSTIATTAQQLPASPRFVPEEISFGGWMTNPMFVSGQIWSCGEGTVET